MRIGLVIEEFDPLRGGAEHWTYQHAIQLVRRGHEVHVVAGKAGAAAYRAPLQLHLWGELRSRLARAEAAATILRRLELDVAHDIGVGWGGEIFQSEDGSRFAQWERMLPTLPPLLRPLKRGLIRVLPRYAEFRRLVGRQFRDPDRLMIAVSRMCAEDYRRYHQVTADRVRVIYHGTDIQRFSPDNRVALRAPTRQALGISDDVVLFLFVGHDFVRKGLKTVQRAVTRMFARGESVRLGVVGEPRSRRTVRAPRSADGVLHCGRVEDAAAYYAAADVFVLPTFYDPCSLSVGEAAASGLPIVTTRYNGASELLTEGIDGHVLTDPADDIALERRLTALLDPDLRARMGAAARRLAEEYPLERNCEEILAVYDEVLRDREPLHSPGTSLSASAP